MYRLELSCRGGQGTLWGQSGGGGDSQRGWERKSRGGGSGKAKGGSEGSWEAVGGSRQGYVKGKGRPCGENILKVMVDLLSLQDLMLALP